ncbi:MAG: adenosylcobinamide-GDP ribazoletransferase [bacterium]|nr:adenosylcobinamide-GDP ribazoletransferase [bacterium]
MRGVKQRFQDLAGAFVIALSMYSRLPLPPIAWNKERMQYAFCFFPVVGVVIGLLLQGSCLLLELRFSWQQDVLLYAGLGTALPLLLTGGIHMDGFLDVTDARSSYGEREKKLEILKDPHTGAFAIIGCAVYLLLYAACFSVLSKRGLQLFSVTFVVTRALSGLSVLCFPKAKNTGLAASFSHQAQKRVVCVVLFLWLLACAVCVLVCFGLRELLLCSVVSALVYGYYYRISVKEFGGMTGDLAGYFLQLCELLLLMGIVFVC